MQDYQEILKKVLISEKKLQTRISALAEQINHDYKDSDGLILVCVLRGGIMFLVDLMRQLKIKHSVDFMAVSSYGIGKRSYSGQARISLDLNTDIGNRDVLIIEDIVDTGITMESLLEQLDWRKPAEVKIATLLFKPNAFIKDLKIDYIGIEIPNDFIVGYGLDYDGFGRNLPDIYKIVK